MHNAFTKTHNIEPHEWPWVILIATVLFIAVLFLCGLLFMATWNLGVVGLAAACGWAVAKIGFWTGVGGALLTSTLASIFGGRRPSRGA